MISRLRITVVVDNMVRKAGLLAEHGLSYWIEADAHRILFDVGQGHVFRYNAERLDVAWPSADALVLSHGHFDHTTGVGRLLTEMDHARLFLHPGALDDRFSQCKTPPHRAIGMPEADRRAIRDRDPQTVVWTKRPTKLFPGVLLTGQVPRRNDFEDVGGRFYLDAACGRPDPIADDQSLLLDTPAGIFVVLGCCHAGIVNTLDYVAELTAGRPLRGVLGGTHLVGATPDRMEQTAAALARYNTPLIAPAHCTGARATAFLQTRLPETYVPVEVGKVFAVDA